MNRVVPSAEPWNSGPKPSTNTEVLGYWSADIAYQPGEIKDILVKQGQAGGELT